MPKNTKKRPVKMASHTANRNGAKPAPNRRKRRKPLSQMTLEELTVPGFQLAYDERQQELNGQVNGQQVHA